MSRIFPLHLAPIDNYFRVDDVPEYPMTFVTQLCFRGQVKRSAFESALKIALDRNPILQALIGRGKGSRLCWIDSQGQSPTLDWATDEVPMACPQGGRIDLSCEVGLRIWIRQGRETADMVFQYHHAATDGNGAHRFLGDLLAAYHHEYSGGDEKIPFDPVDPRQLRNRRRKMAGVAVDGSFWQLLREVARQGFEIYGKTICPLASPRSVADNHRPFPGHVTFTFSKHDHKALTDAAQDAGVLLNDLLLSELFQTVVAWNERHHNSSKGLIRILMPSDLRDHSDFEMPAANMTSYSYISRRANVCRNGPELEAGVQQEVLKIRHERRATRFMDAIMLMERIPWAMTLLSRWPRCLSTIVLSNVGDPTRRFRVRLPRREGKIACGNLVLESWAGVSPLRRHTRAAITVNTYARSLAVSVNCDPHAFNAQDTDAFLASFVSRLRQRSKSYSRPQLNHCVPV